MKFKAILLTSVAILSLPAFGQEVYKFKLDIPVFDYSDNLDMPHRFPSMTQATSWSYDMYELGFFGIDELGNWLFGSENSDYGKWKKLGNNVFKYAASLAFARFGSELPIPLGVWAHEEFHRSVLGANDIRSYNGNWIFDRWDGTVYGLSDETLGDLKLSDSENLLYSYVSGVQYEILLNEKITLGDFYYKKSFPRSALVLYNAYYVWNYFSFSASSSSDSAKVLAPPHEDIDPVHRDYAGSDLTSWVYDMFNPGEPYSRDPFPGGNGLNRRIGFSDLDAEEQDYLTDQKKLSLLNFLNPAIFFVNRIPVTENLSFNLFTRYAPAHFGNDIGLFVPFKYKTTGMLFNVHRFGGHTSSGFGFGLALFDIGLSGRMSLDMKADFWNQPESFFSAEKVTGVFAGVKPTYSFSDSFSGYVQLSAKSRGWLIGNPYLDANFSAQAGISWKLID